MSPFPDVPAGHPEPCLDNARITAARWLSPSAWSKDPLTRVSPPFPAHPPTYRALRARSPPPTRLQPARTGPVPSDLLELTPDGGQWRSVACCLSHTLSRGRACEGRRAHREGHPSRLWLVLPGTHQCVRRSTSRTESVCVLGHCVLHGPLYACVSVCVWGHLQHVGATRGVQTSVSLKHLPRSQVQARNVRLLTKGSVPGFRRRTPTPRSEKPLPPNGCPLVCCWCPCSSLSLQGTVPAALPSSPTARALPLSLFSPCGSLSGGAPSSKAGSALSFPPPAGSPYTLQSACHWAPCFSAFLSPFLQSLVFLRPQRVD